MGMGSAWLTLLLSSLFFIKSIAWQITPSDQRFTRRTVLRDESPHSLSHHDDDSAAVGTDYQLRFGAVGRLYAKDDTISSMAVLSRLQKSTVVIVGLGGVGSWTAEALCRSGVGRLVLVDLDDVCISNMNRQLHALSSTVGKMKVDVLKKRLLQINPSCDIELVHEFVDRTNVESVFDELGRNGTINSVTYVVDAIDHSRDKAALIALCTERSIPIVTCGAAAGLRNPMAIICEDLSRIKDDKLLSTTRRELRRWYGFPEGLSMSMQRKLGKRQSKWRIVAVVSDEPPSLPSTKSDDISSSLRRCDGALGTASFVTGTFGLVAASVVVEGITQQSTPPVPRKHRHSVGPSEHARREKSKHMTNEQ